MGSSRCGRTWTSGTPWTSWQARIARLLECRQTLEDKRRDKMDTDQALTLYGLRDWMTQEMTARLSTHSNPPQLPPSKIIFTAEVVTIIKDVWLPFTIVISIIKTVTNYALHLH